MRSLALAFAFTALALSTALADESCKAQANDKKLAGAALTSFMKKCEIRCRIHLRYASCGQEALGCGQRQLHQEVRQGRDRHLVVL